MPAYLPEGFVFRERKSGEIEVLHIGKLVGVPGTRISEIVAGRRSITADTDLRVPVLRSVGGYWLRAKVAHDTEVALERLAGELDKIRPWAAALAAAGRHRDRDDRMRLHPLPGPTRPVLNGTACP